jgi:hypothetical protein
LWIEIGAERREYTRLSGKRESLEERTRNTRNQSTKEAFCEFRFLSVFRVLPASDFPPHRRQDVGDQRTGDERYRGQRHFEGRIYA